MLDLWQSLMLILLETSNIMDKSAILRLIVLIIKVGFSGVECRA